MDPDIKQANMITRNFTIAARQKQDMDRRPDINWSLVVRKAIHRKLIKLSKEKES